LRRTRFIIICLAALLAMAIVPAWAAATPVLVVDDDFAFGTTDANTLSFSPGFVVLRPVVTFNEGFDGTSLPTGWTLAPWAPGGTGTVAGGVLTVDGARVDGTPSSAPGQTLDFVATFGPASAPDAFEHAGFGTTYDSNTPWAMFSTGGGGTSSPVGLWARSSDGTAANTFDTKVNVNPTVPHAYRIEWTSTEVDFFVDGTQVAQHLIAIAQAMHPAVSDFALGGGAATVASMSLAPAPPVYPASGVFTSRVFDGSPRLTGWGAASASGNIDGVTLQTRSGSVPAPDGSWSDWQSLGSSGAIQSPARRYLQYRAILTSGGTVTPVLDRVTLSYDVDTTVPPATVTVPPAAVPGVPVAGTSAVVRRDTVAPKVVPSPRSVRASRGGTVTFRVGCPTTEQLCKITLQLKRGRKAVSSKKMVNLLGGKRAKVTLRLTKKYRAYLSTHARLKVKAVTAAYDAANNLRTTHVKVTVRAPKR
jgi:hypothetical protein